jgi:hypothetical protein
VLFGVRAGYFHGHVAFGGNKTIKADVIENNTLILRNDDYLACSMPIGHERDIYVIITLNSFRHFYGTIRRTCRN